MNRNVCVADKSKHILEHVSTDDLATTGYRFFTGWAHMRTHTHTHTHTFPQASFHRYRQQHHLNHVNASNTKATMLQLACQYMAIILTRRERKSHDSCQQHVWEKKYSQIKEISYYTLLPLFRVNKPFLFSSLYYYYN